MNRHLKIIFESKELGRLVFECPNCSQKLYKYPHSPWHSTIMLYCTDCPKAVEVNEFDKTINDFVDKQFEAPARDPIKIQKFIQDNIIQCDCGGKFSQNSKRRCFSCNEVMRVADNCDLTIYQECLQNEDGDMTEDEEVEWNEFRENFVIENGYWKNEHPQ